MTQTLFLGAAGALTAVVAVAFGQESSDPAGPEALRPVHADESGQDVPDGAPVRPFLEPLSGFDESQESEFDLRERLSQRDLESREVAFDEIARRAARDPDIRRALQAIGDDTSDLDIAFTARLALREADRLASWGRAGAGFGRQALPTRPSAPDEALRQRLESVFGSDPFVDEFFSSDPFFTRPFGGRGGVFGVDPFAGSDPFEDMRRRVDDIRKQMDQLRGGAPGLSPGGARSFSTRSSIKFETTPDGVRVEVVEDDGSETVTNVYEAESIDALLRAHPQLEGKIGR